MELRASTLGAKGFATHMQYFGIKTLYLCTFVLNKKEFRKNI